MEVEDLWKAVGRPRKKVHAVMRNYLSVLIDLNPGHS